MSDMTDATSSRTSVPNQIAERALHGSGVLWFLTAVAGQWLFAFYVAAYYGPMVLNGGLAGLAESHLPNSFVPGDTLGNLAIASHLLIAVIIMFGGPLQLTPQIRNRFPTFHRWNGRVFMATVVITSISGLYMVWVRGSVGDFGMHVGISLNGVLIILFAAIALRYAIARKIDIHRRWAMRLFLVVNGVWFARVGLWFWMLITNGSGIDFETFTGPFLTFLNFGQYLVPLAVFELYLRAQDHASAPGKAAMAAFLFFLTMLMGVGVYQAAITIWLPKL